jgi:hypothetical protein
MLLLLMMRTRRGRIVMGVWRLGRLWLRGANPSIIKSINKLVRIFIKYIKIIRIIDHPTIPIMCNQPFLTMQNQPSLTMQNQPIPITQNHAILITHNTTKLLKKVPSSSSSTLILWEKRVKSWTDTKDNAHNYKDKKINTSKSIIKRSENLIGLSNN